MKGKKQETSKDNNKPKGWFSRQHETREAHDHSNRPATPRERQAGALARRMWDLAAYETEQWWESAKECVERFPEYPHLTSNNQRAFRAQKIAAALFDIFILEEKLGVKHTVKFNRKTNSYERVEADK
jgi:hypothetical protein